MARPAPDRIGVLGGVRAEMMSENLRAMVAQEQRRGPSLVFAHNEHLHRATSVIAAGASEAIWSSAGGLIGSELGERYVVVTTDTALRSGPHTLQGLLAQSTIRRTLFPASVLRAALPETIEPREPLVPGHIPLRPGDLEGADAVVLLADTDGTQYRYW
jgi:hypothetical protein